MTIYIVNSFYPKITEANEIAKLVIKKKLAACVNISKDIKSIFMWNNKLNNIKEVELSFKTNEKKVKQLVSFLEKNHSYDCPCIIASPIKKNNKKFLNWLNQQIN